MNIRPWQNLYIHVPFCAGKCDYCAFYSEGTERDLMRPWLNKIKSELEKLTENPPFHTVYIGGGTPTLMDPEMLTELFSTIRKQVPLQIDAEISIECNPETMTTEKAQILGNSVNRVSLGIQSFSPVARERIGRRGDPEKIFEAVSLLRTYGIRNIGCDLIYALPCQTIPEWEEELRQALALEINHLSAYSLSVEEGTPLALRYQENHETDDLSFEMEKSTRRILQDAGLSRYEISNYAKTGFSCQHNTNVWYGETYLGLGPSACSFNGVDRFTQSLPIRKWLEGEAPVYDRISELERLGEIFIMGLRTVNGWKISDFEKIAEKSPLKIWNQQLASLETKGWLVMTDDRIALSTAGLDFWNEAAMEIL